MSDNSIQVYKESDFGELILDTQEYAGELTIEVAAEHIPQVIETLKSGFGFNYLSDITATDHFTDEKRFEVAYNLVSIENRNRLRITCKVEEDKPEVPSIVHLFQAAAWNEREAYDMIGVTFPRNPDLRRMFMPEDFEYYPLRKEFPLIGIPGSIQIPEKDPPKEYK